MTPDQRQARAMSWLERVDVFDNPGTHTVSMPSPTDLLGHVIPAIRGEHSIHDEGGPGPHQVQVRDADRPLTSPERVRTIDAGGSHMRHAPSPQCFASFLAVSAIATVVIGCGATTTTPSPSMSAEQTACLGQPQPEAPGPWPVLPIVVRIDAGADSALLLAGSNPTSGGLMYVWPCRVQRLPSGNVPPPPWSPSTFPAPQDPTLSLDQASKSGNRPDDRMVAGRVGPNVARVEVALADGTKATTAVSNGYYLGWWRGTDADPVRITALDASGKDLRVIADPGGLLPPK
jgi:hypothetical protein